MLMVIKVDDTSIAEAKFSTYGCPAAVACGQYVTEFVQGKSKDMAARIDEPQIIAAIGEMPLGRQHCPALAVAALQDALRQWDFPSELAIGAEGVGTSKGEGL